MKENGGDIGALFLSRRTATCVAVIAVARARACTPGRACFGLALGLGLGLGLIRVRVRRRTRVREMYRGGPRLGLAAQWREARALGLRLLRVIC